jgi:hypothetical protein
MRAREGLNLALRSHDAQVEIDASMKRGPTSLGRSDGRKTNPPKDERPPPRLMGAFLARARRPGATTDSDSGDQKETRIASTGGAYGV